MEIAIGIAVGLALVGCAIWVGLRQMEEKPHNNYYEEKRHDPVPGGTPTNGAASAPD